jgi:hypothetical protein
MKIPTALRLLAHLGLTFALPYFVQAADNPTNEAIPMPVLAAQTAPTPTPFDLEIRNGSIIENNKEVAPATVGSVMDYLKKAHKNFNIILGPGVADLRISDLVLHLPEYKDGIVFNAIAACVGDDAETSVIDAGIFTIKTRQSNQVRQTQVFNLTNYLNPDGKADDTMLNDKLQTLIDIIFRTLDDLHPNTPSNLRPNFQFHRGANLLVVIGMTDAIEVSNQVVNALLEHPSTQDQLVAVGLTAPGGFQAPDPSAAQEWAKSLPGSNSDTAKRIAELQDLIATVRREMLAANTPQRSKDLQQRLDTLNKLMQEIKPGAHDLPDKNTSP